MRPVPNLLCSVLLFLIITPTEQYKFCADICQTLYLITNSET